MYSTEIKDIYGNLQDDLSRKIFECKFFYLLTGNTKFIRKMIEANYNEYDIEAFNLFIKWVERIQSGYKGIIVYGAGLYGEVISSYFDKKKIVAVCDSNKDKQDTVVFGHKVISLEQLQTRYSSNDYFVLVTILNKKSERTVYQNLINLGFNENRMIGIGMVFHALQANLKFKHQYFLSFLKPDLDEVFIDAGCLDFDTSIDFIKWSSPRGEYERIVAFEPDQKQYSFCVEQSKKVKNATVHPYALWNESTELSFVNDLAGSAHITNNADGVKVKAVKLDDILNGQKATFIKMDIEGAELNALKGAEQTILKYRPKLAICIYHKLDDIVEIPQYILSLHSDYRLYIRHHGLFTAETVLYAT